MFANVTLQDILATLQAPPPEMQAAPGFAELLRYSEQDWSQWLAKLQQLDAEGQDLAALPADFLLLPESGLDRAAVEGMGFLQLPADTDAAGQDGPTAMAMLAALLYQPDLTPRAGAETPEGGNTVTTLPQGIQQRASIPLEQSRWNRAWQPAPESPPPVPQAAMEEARPAPGPLAGLTAQAPALGLMAALMPARMDLDSAGPELRVMENPAQAPELAQALQARMANSNAASAQPASSPPLLQPHSPAFAQQMQQQVQFMLKQDMKQMEVRLDPPELGAMKIHLKLDNGLTHVQIITATSEARDLLHASQAQMREALPMNQGQLQLDIRHQPGSQGGSFTGMDADDQHAEQDKGASGGPEAEAGSVTGTPARPWLEQRMGQGLVDTFV